MKATKTSALFISYIDKPANIWRRSLKCRTAHDKKNWDFFVIKKKDAVTFENNRLSSWLVSK